MATILYFRAAASDFGTGTNDANLATVAQAWDNRSLSTARGSSATSATRSSVAGPTNGIEMGTSAIALVWYSPPLDADATISGSITWNLRAAISAMTTNGAVNAQIEVIDGATGTITLIDKTARTTEAGTTETVQNFAETPASGVACKRGDRLRVRVFFDDSVDGNMASGGTCTLWYDGPTGAATGDSYFTLTENLTFVSEPAGTTIYPTDTASAVSTASVDREAWTSRGAGVQTDVVTSVTGWTAPIQYTDTAGGTVVDWFTKQLAAFTLGGAVRVNARAGFAGSSLAVVRCEIARVASDGTSATVWGATTNAILGGYGNAEAARSFLVGGDDLAVSDGQRLRVRFYLDDGGRPMASGNACTLYYAGTSGGASGDTYLTFTQTLTEYSASQTATPTAVALTLSVGTPTVTAPFTGQPTVAALTLSAGTPTVGIGASSQPTAVALTLAAGTPTVVAVGTAVSQPTAVALTLSRGTPTVTAPALSQPTAVALTLTAGTPTVLAPRLSQPTTAALVLAAGTPAVAAPFTGQPTAAALTLSRGTPTVTAIGTASSQPTAAALVLTGATPTVAAVGTASAQPTVAALTLSTGTPTVTAGAGGAISSQPTAATLTLSTATPAVAAPRVSLPTAAALSLGTGTPTVALTQNRLVLPTAMALVMTLSAPNVVSSAHLALEPLPAVLVLVGHAPSVEIHSAIPLPDMVYGFAIVAMGDSGAVGSAQGGATVRVSEGGSTAVSTSGSSAGVSIR